MSRKIFNPKKTLTPLMIIGVLILSPAIAILTAILLAMDEDGIQDVKK